MKAPASSLRIGERLIARCDDGLFDAEYLLFTPADITLRAADPVTVREEGYITSAKLARGRLAEASVGIKLVESARAAVPSDVARSFARGAAAAGIMGDLGAYELFEGGTYDAATQLYEGVWLDLRAFATAVPLRGAAAVLQAMHLAAVLAEMPDDAPVHLSTRTALATRRPGERTYRRIAVSHAYDLPAALATMKPRLAPAVADPRRDEARRAELLRRLRARGASASESERARVDHLEVELDTAAAVRGPLADPDLSAIDAQLASGESAGIAERLERLDLARGRTPALRYLRARLALVEGSESPRIVAESLSELADGAESFHEVELLAARAWLAAGDEGHARYFARSIVDDPAAPDGVRLLALEIVESTQTTARSHAPPAPRGEASSSAPRVVVVAPPPPGASLPPFATEPPPSPRAAPASGPRRDYGRNLVEIVEALALPDGADESMLAPGAPPRTALEARIAFTRIARDVGRDYRLFYGTTLKTDWIAVDAMQRHLRGRFGRASEADARLRDELFRHGALLSEIIARTLHASWVDITPSEPGYWAMLVPPDTRTFPVGRVHRFFALGNEEKDLVGYCLELESRARAALLQSTS